MLDKLFMQNYFSKEIASFMILQFFKLKWPIPKKIIFLSDNKSLKLVKKDFSRFLKHKSNEKILLILTDSFDNVSKIDKYMKKLKKIYFISFIK